MIDGMEGKRKGKKPVEICVNFRVYLASIILNLTKAERKIKDNATSVQVDRYAANGFMDN